MDLPAWIPAFAGMTGTETDRTQIRPHPVFFANDLWTLTGLAPNAMILPKIATTVYPEDSMRTKSLPKCLLADVSRILITLMLMSAVLWPAGCKRRIRSFEDLKVRLAKPSAPKDEPPAREQIDLLLPRKIDILKFTKPASFDDDQIPDGLEVVLRPLDAYGDQTKAIGRFRFELYQSRKASADPRGTRLGLWEVDLSSKEAHDQHWEWVSRTYRFRLLWTGQQVKPGKYILDVTYISPWGQRITGTYELEAQIPREKIKERIEKRRKRFGFF